MHTEYPNATLSSRTASLLRGASLAAIALTLIAPAYADTIWLGTANSTWSNPANWSNGAPVASTPVVVFNTATAPGITASGSIGAGSFLFTGTANQNISGFAILSSSSIENQVNYTATFTGTNILLSGGSTVRASNPDGGGIVLNAVVRSILTASLTFDTVNSANTITLVKGVNSIHTVVKTGDGTLFMGAATTAQEIDLNGGNFNIVADTGLGSVGFSSTIFNGGTLQFGGAFATAAARTMTLAGDGGFDTNGNDDTLASAVTGAGALIKKGAGTLILTGANNYSGGTFLNGGSLSVANDALLGAAAGALNFNGGVLQVTGTGFTSTARAINWGANGGGFDIADAGNLFTVAQPLTGGGPLTKAGAGALLLTGINTYAGGTIISGGTLTGSATSLGSGAILDNAALVISQPADADFANPLNGTGSFVKQGAGRLNLTGIGTLSGSTTVTAGILSVNGGIANSAVTVQSGATLGGNGTVGATTIQSGATIAPGNSIGTLHVNGAFVQSAGSLYQVELDPASNASDLILVNGAASLASGAGLNVTKTMSGNYSPGAQYTVLTASGGVTGSYALTGNTAVSQYLMVQQQQDADNVYLRVIQTGDPATAAQTSNQTGVAAAVDSLPPANPVSTGILNSPSAAAARSGFDALSGEALASSKGALVSGSLLVRDTTFDRLRDIFCGTADQSGDARQRPGCAPQTTQPALWAQGFGNWGHISGNANAAGLSQSTGGFLVGVDMPVYDWRVGYFGGYSRTDFDVKGRSSSGIADNYHLGLYGGTQWGDLGLRLGASYSWSNLATDRSVAVGNLTDNLKAAYNAGTTQIFGELGQRFALDQFALEPFANLAYVNLRTDGFSETGGDAALTSRADTMEDGFATLGVRPSTEISFGSFTATAHGMAGWRHAFGDVTPASTVSFAGSDAFTVSGAPIARDAGVIEAGLAFNVTGNAAIGLTYGGQFGGGETETGVRGTLAWSF